MTWTLEQKRESGRKYARRIAAEKLAAETPEQKEAKAEKKRLAQIPWAARNKEKHNRQNRLNFLKKFLGFTRIRKL